MKLREWENIGLVERFWRYVGFKSEGCWPWLGPLNSYGYGKLSNWGVKLNRTEAAHRLAVLFNGRRIPPGMEIDHLCRNRRCVRPSHLDVVTKGENMRRGNSPSAVKHRAGVCGQCGGPWNYRSTDGRSYCRRCNRKHAQTTRGRKKELA